MSADNFAIWRAHTLYTQMRHTGFFAGSVKLYELERALWECFDHCIAEERLVCFVLATVLHRIAASQENGPVTADHGVALANALNQPINQCMDYLLARNVGQPAEQLLAALVEAYAPFRN